MVKTVLLRRREVEARTGLSRSTIYQKVAQGEFPAPVSIGGRSVAWVEQEVDTWIDQAIVRSRGGKV